MIYIYIYIKMHTRNRHLGNHRGLSVAFSNGIGLSVVYSSEMSLLSGIVQSRTVQS